MEISKRGNIFIEWFLWQFYEMPKFLLEVWNNYFMFATNYFSLPLLFKTFFSPWRRYRWKYPKGFDAVEFLNTFISNIFSRILGAIMRTGLIIMGILFQIITAIAGIIVFIGWILMPFIIITGFYLFLVF